MCRQSGCPGCLCGPADTEPCSHCREGHGLSNLIEEIDQEKKDYKQRLKEFFFGKP